MSETPQWVVFRLEQTRYALALAAVERIVRAVAITPLPKAPPIVLGVIDVEGQILPVLNLRRRFRLPEREMGPSDQFIIARTVPRTVTLCIDAAEGVIERPTHTIVQPDSIVPGLDHLQGVIQLEDGLVLIHDLEQFLALDEARALDKALKRETARGG